jgi:long-chain acyl-CoA synthetase
MTSVVRKTDVTIGEMIRRLASESPTAPAVTFDGATYSFADLDQRSNRVAQALLAAGVAAQHRVALVDKNAVEFFDVIFGASKVDAVVVPVNWRQASAEVLRILADCRPKVLFLGREYANLLEEDTEGTLDGCRVVVFGGGVDGQPSFAEWIAPFGSDPVEIRSTDDEAYLQLYTSGTTGAPKGVVITNRTSQLFGDLAEQLRFREGSVLLMVLPLFHTSSSIALSALSAGGHCILHREVDLPASLAAIGEHRVTHAGFVPALLAALNPLSEKLGGDFSSLELIMYGASPISETVLRDSMRVFGCDFAQLYGLTESGGTVSMLMPEDHDPDGRPELLRSMGKPLPWVTMQISNPDGGAALGDEEVGEVWVRSRQVMREYAGRPAETEAALTPDAWLRTGDLGYRNADGFYFLQDRLKDMIVSGAENVYPAEVENALMAHPGIRDVAVIGVPDARWGETVKAIVVPTEATELSEREVIDFARSRIAHYKCPTSVDFTTEELPRNPSGKLLKRIIREPYWSEQGRRIG